MQVVSETTHLDEFALARELGRGGSGIVYEAAHGEARVALKVQRELDEREKERFLREAQLMRRVSHPGLVRLLGSGVFSDGRAYLVMDLLHGETLAARLRQGAIPVQEAIRVFTPLASAVQTLHDEGLVHRDIKPENIMLAREESGATRPVLLDFGIVREVNGLASTTTQAGFVRGSRAYMAPERFFGQGASVASDVYELGVTLYMMLAGRLPWGEEDAAGSRLDPEALPRPSGRALSRVVMRAISTRPEQRFPSAGAFRDAVILAADAASVPEMARTTDAEPALAPPKHSDTDSSASITIEAPTMPYSGMPAAQMTTKPMSVRARASLPWIIVAAALFLGVGGTFAVTRFMSPRAHLPQPGSGADTSNPTAGDRVSGADPTQAAKGSSGTSGAATMASSVSGGRVDATDPANPSGSPGAATAATAPGASASAIIAALTASSSGSGATNGTRGAGKGTRGIGKPAPSSGKGVSAGSGAPNGAQGAAGNGGNAGAGAPNTAPSAGNEVYYLDRH